MEGVTEEQIAVAAAFIDADPELSALVADINQKLDKQQVAQTP
jgi:hypothetical protein